MSENYSDISCERIGNLVYIKSDGIVVMIVTADKERRTLAYCENGNWNSVKGQDRFSVEDMEAMVKECLNIGRKNIV